MTELAIEPLTTLEKIGLHGVDPGAAVGETAGVLRGHRVTLREASERLAAAEKLLTGPKGRRLDVDQRRVLREHSERLADKVKNLADHARRHGAATAASLAATRAEILFNENGYSTAARETRAARREQKLRDLAGMDPSERLDVLQTDELALEAVALAPARVRDRLGVPSGELERLERDLLERRDPRRAAALLSASDHARQLDAEVTAATRSAERVRGMVTDPREVARMERVADAEAERQLRRMLAGGDEAA